MTSLGTIVLRGGVEVENPLELALEFLEAYSSYEAHESSGPASFDESDLRLANRGGARISAAEIAAILERRGEIERALRRIHPDASLADATSSIPWIALTRLFDAFADIRGIGFSKMTKALHRKRPALIPMLDSVVQAYLTRDDPRTRSTGSFGERSTALVRSYKRDLDRNRSVLQELQRELASRTYRLTEVRILDLLIWSVSGGV
jgi:transposase